MGRALTPFHCAYKIAAFLRPCPFKNELRLILWIKEGYLPLPGVIEKDFIEAFVSKCPRPVFERLLCDRTTGGNIIWVDAEYGELGDGYSGDDETTVEKITGDMSGLIRARAAKGLARQSSCTKSRAEVFTPPWLANSMNNALDADWFGYDDAFNVEEGSGWKVNQKRMAFPKCRRSRLARLHLERSARDHLRRDHLRMLPLRHRDGRGSRCRGLHWSARSQTFFIAMKNSVHG